MKVTVLPRAVNVPLLINQPPPKEMGQLTVPAVQLAAEASRVPELKVIDEVTVIGSCRVHVPVVVKTMLLKLLLLD